MQASLRRNRNFRNLLLGETVSELGSNLSSLAYPLLVLALTHSPFLAGVVGSAQLVVAAVFRLPAGAVADRFDRRSIMLICDGVRLVALGGLGVLVLLHRASWELVLLVSVAESSLSVFFSPAESGAVRAVVTEPEQLPQAMASNEVRHYGASVAGPALGGALFSLAQGAPFLADGLSYVISIVTVSSLRGKFRAQGGSAQRIHQEIAAGLAFVFRRPFLRSLVVMLPLINFAFDGAIFVVIVAMRRSGVHADVIGVAAGLISAGGLLGAVLAAWILRRTDLWRLVMIICWIGSALFLVSGREAGSILMAIPVALSLVLAPPASAALMARQMAITPDELQGRVQSIVNFAAQGLAAAAPLLAGVLIARASATLAMAVFAGAMALAGLVCTLSRGVREESKSAEPSRQLRRIARTPTGAAKN